MNMNERFVPLVGFESDYEIMIESPHIIKKIGVDSLVGLVGEWYNRDGIAAVELNGKMYLKDDLIERQFGEKCDCNIQ